MLKKDNGITLIALGSAIIIMIIIFSITIISATDILRNTQVNRLRVNLRLIKTQAATMFEDYMFDGTDNLGSKATTAEIQAVGWKEIEGVEYRIWDMEKVNSLGIDLKKSQSSEKFIIQLNTKTNEVDVASTKGYSDGKGNNYYSLNSLKNFEE